VTPEGGEALPLAQPVIGERERQLVDEVLRSGKLSLGPMVERFERSFAERIGCARAVATSSGTAGLHMCLHALGLGPGDEVVPSSFSFVASANAVRFTGADPVFAEVDEYTFNMDPEAVEAAITPRTKAILIVDIFGYPAEVPALRAIAERHGLGVVEDACQTVDGAHDGVKLGTHGHPAVYGFYANKQLTTAEGGVVLTDDERTADLLKSLSNQGRSDDGAWLVHSRLGFNYRMSDVHAAIGVAQLERLDELMAGRARVAGWYQERVHRIEGVTPMYEGPQPRSWFVYAPRIEPGADRDQVIAELARRGIQAKPYLPCIHLQPYYREQFGFKPGDFPIAETISQRTIALPFFNQMDETHVELVCHTLKVMIQREKLLKQ